MSIATFSLLASLGESTTTSFNDEDLFLKPGRSGLLSPISMDTSATLSSSIRLSFNTAVIESDTFSPPGISSFVSVDISIKSNKVYILYS